MSTDHGCGIFGFSPKWLQNYATQRCFLMVYGLLGTVQAMGYLYFVVTLTTIEKRFKIPSQTTGIVLSGNEVSQILLSLFLSYFGGQRNRPRWMAWGVMFCSLSCFILAWPHFLYGAGDDALRLTKEYADEFLNITLTGGAISNPRDNQLCSARHAHDDCETGEIFSYVPLVLIFMSQFVLGIGNTLYYSLGQSYLDDNTKKGNTPLVLAYALSLRMFGPVIGFLLGYVTLNIYIDPTKTPLITNKDPRWMGAWWLGWVLLGTAMLLFAVLIGMFPKALPKCTDGKGEEVKAVKALSKSTALDEVRKSRLSLDGELIGSVTDIPQLKDLPTALLRLLKNKLLMFNITANIFYILGSSGHITFLTKYLEVQFNKAASDGTIVTGPITILGMTIGFLFSGWFITKYRPSPRHLFFWNFLIGIVVMFGQYTYMILECDVNDSLQLRTNFSIQSTCNADCFCDGISYSPVCDTSTNTTYFSPCHAGCRNWNETQGKFTNCQCNERLFDRLESVSSTTVDFRISSFVDDDDEGITDTEYDESQEVSDIQRIGSRSHRDRRSASLSVDQTNDSSFDFSSMLPGSCGQSCEWAFKIFTIISMCLNLLGATGKIGNILLNFRAVDQKDKAFAQGLSLMLLSLLALIPGPIVYGIVIDYTCIVWSNKCGTRGNCQLYDKTQFRRLLNMMSMTLTVIAAFFDLLVWHYGKNLNLYDEDEDTKPAKGESNQHQIQPLLEEGDLEKADKA